MTSVLSASAARAEPGRGKELKNGSSLGAARFLHHKRGGSDSCRHIARFCSQNPVTTFALRYLFLTEHYRNRHNPAPPGTPLLFVSEADDGSAMFSTARCHPFCWHLRGGALLWRKMNKRGRKVWLSLGDLLPAPARCLGEAEDVVRDESRGCGGLRAASTRQAEPRSSTGTAQQTDESRSGETREKRDRASVAVLTAAFGNSEAQGKRCR